MALAGWLSWLDHCSHKPKGCWFRFSILGQGTYLGYRFDTGLGRVQVATNWYLSLSLPTPSSFTQINKRILDKDLKKIVEKYYSTILSLLKI